jgi:hypothetical protein
MEKIHTAESIVFFLPRMSENTAAHLEAHLLHGNEVERRRQEDQARAESVWAESEQANEKRVVGDVWETKQRPCLAFIDLRTRCEGARA